MKNLKNKLIAMIISSLTVLTLVACGSSDYESINAGESVKDYMSDSAPAINSFSTAGYGEDATYNDYSSDDYSDVEASSTESTTVNNDNKISVTGDDAKYVQPKLVYYCDITIETLDYDKSYVKIKELIDKYGCFIESERFTNNDNAYYNGNYYKKRHNILTIRVPSDNYEALLNEGESLGNIVSKTNRVENITLQYYDTTAQLEVLEAQLDKLNELLNQATEMEDIYAIYQEVTNLEYEINKLKTDIRTYDMDVNYSYVSISLLEVVEYSEVVEPEKENTFLDRLKNTVKNTYEDMLTTLEGLLFSLISLAPTLVIIAVVIIVYRVVTKKFKRSTRNIEKEAREEIDKLKNEEV